MVCKEAVSMFIPIIGVIDSNVKHHYYNLPIPSNDDSLKSIVYLYTLISKNIILYKYKKVIL
jgi:ribosomal protein S2